MFRSRARTLRAWWEDFSEDILGADLGPSFYAEDELEYNLSHPHRQPLIGSRLRRDGAVMPTPAHCLSPVQRGHRVAAEHPLTR